MLELNDTSQGGGKSSINLEALFKKQDLTNMVNIQLNFIKKKAGEDKLINILRILDKGYGEISEKEASDKIIGVVGQGNFQNINQTLQRILKLTNYKFKN